MSLRYLVDTNVLSEPVQPQPDARVLRSLRIHELEIATASIVWHELLFGVHRLPESTKRRALERYLNGLVAAGLTILPYDDRAASWHALERARLTRTGTTPPFSDSQIASIAAVHRLVLVTHNTADYAQFRGLQVEDWTSEA